MQQLEYEQTQVRGELSYRILKNYARLEGKEYRPGRIYHMGKRWPGDWEGRTRLAWVLLSRISKRKPAYLEDVDAQLDQYLNDRHYFSKILPEGMADEQQISGHNWFLRSLLEEYLWTGSEEAAQRARKLVENLYLPLRGMYEKYPFRPDDRNRNGKASGHIEGEAENGWYLSTDIGCAFMPLDGLGQYFQIFGDERVGELLNEMTASIKRIDMAACSMQTHAALSAARGVLRYYQCCRRPELLTYVVNLFELYMESGMTENYANYNWFCKPDWTEPCAIVDSYLLAVELFKETRDYKYVSISNRILYNALCHAQRENGGFGCDKCAGSPQTPDILAVYPQCYEAFWCCSMRGGEGLSKAAVQAVLKDERDFYFLNYISMGYESKNICFTVSTEYPKLGKVDVRVEGIAEPAQFRFYLPEGTQICNVKILADGEEAPFQYENGFLCVDITKDCRLHLDFPIALKTGEPVNRALRGQYKSLWYGDLMLGCRQKAGEQTLEQTKMHLPTNLKELRPQGKGRFYMEENLLEPVGGSIYHDRENMIANQFRILYAVDKAAEV